MAASLVGDDGVSGEGIGHGVGIPATIRGEIGGDWVR
jgi:hypothetical protein